MKKKIKITFLLLIILVCSKYSTSFPTYSKDSILSEILNAKNTAHLKSIKADVGPKVMALNNWANEALWSEPGLVKEVANELIRYALDNNNDSLLSWSYHYLGISYYHLNYWKISIDAYKKALETNWAINSDGAGYFRAFCALNIGCNFELLGNYDKAAEYYYKSIRMNEEFGIPYVAAEAKLDVASLNIRMNNQEEARNNILESLDVLSEFQDSARLSEGYRMLASIEISDKNYEKAEYYRNEALSIGSKLNDTERLVKIYQDYGDALFYQKLYPKALLNYNKALEYCIPSKFPATYFQLTGRFGKVQLELKQYNLAEKSLLEAYNGLKNLDASSLLLEIEQNLATLYAMKSDKKLFEQYFSLAISLKDTLAAIEKIRSIGESEVIYKTAQKDRQIEIQHLLLASRKNKIFLISVTAIVLFLAIIMLLHLLKRVRKVNRELLERNIELSRQWDRIQGTYFNDKKPDAGSKLFKKIYSLVVDNNEYSNSKMSVDHLARELNSNSKYISQAISTKTGMNFNTFINTFRIEKAKELLRNEQTDDRSLETIAEECGFNNNTTFYQTFKRNTGLTPSKYRNIPS
jgi:YesN/AraC family two-component response regulator